MVAGGEGGGFRCGEQGGGWEEFITNWPKWGRGWFGKVDSCKRNQGSIVFETSALHVKPRVIKVMQVYEEPQKHIFAFKTHCMTMSPFFSCLLSLNLPSFVVIHTRCRPPDCAVVASGVNQNHSTFQHLRNEVILLPILVPNVTPLIFY